MHLSVRSYQPESAVLIVGSHFLVAVGFSSGRIGCRMHAVRWPITADVCSSRPYPPYRQLARAKQSIVYAAPLQHINYLITHICVGWVLHIVVPGYDAEINL
jgi:hypothetical protein